jgi:hypothetical protein
MVFTVPKQFVGEITNDQKHSTQMYEVSMRDNGEIVYTPVTVQKA